MHKWKALGILSNMESIDVAEQARIIERAEAAPYVNYPPTPRLYHPGAGLWAAAMVLSYTLLRDNLLVFAIAVGSLLVIEFGYLSWAAKRYGALPWPGRGNPPAEIAAQYRAFFIGAGVSALLVVASWFLLGGFVAAGLAFVLVAGGTLRYEHTYARAAAGVRARLAC